MLHSTTLPAPVDPAPPAVAQATSDEGVIALWVRNYRSANTRGAYATDVQAFSRFVVKPLRSPALGDIQAFTASIAHIAPASV